MTPKAIETTYKGYRFRSRLEARWAVFFDTLGVRWEYEPQGYQVGWRLHAWDEEGTFPYLPDFWLPDHDVFAEVKGQLTDEELLRLLNAAAYLSTNGGAGCHDAGGSDLVVLGPIPDPTERLPQMPIRLHMHKGLLRATRWLADSPHGRSIWLRHEDGLWDWIAQDDGTTALLPDARRMLLEGAISDSPPPTGYIQALRAARAARFEWGEGP